jgi:RpiB/LacA/LacB family sugar-phosphate isomerase
VASVTTFVIGSDHAGFPLKKHLKDAMKSSHRIIDVGTDSQKQVDYPDFAFLLGQAIRDGRAKKGILICGSGVGASVAANKIRGIRAGLCHDHFSVHQGVEHDDMNVLVLGARVIGPEVAVELVAAFLYSYFSREPRHVRRLKKVLYLDSQLPSALPNVQSSGDD